MFHADQEDDEDGENDTWWDCEQNIALEVADDIYDSIHHSDDVVDGTITDPYFCSLDTIDMSTVSPSIFDKNELSSSATDAATTSDDYYCEPVESTPTGLLEETVSKMENYTTFVGSSMNKEEEEAAMDERLKGIFVKANQDDIENILAKQMDNLSIQEQLDGCKDVHGGPITSRYESISSSVNDNTAEAITSSNMPSPEMEQEKILELMVELAARSTKTPKPSNSRAFYMAMSMDSNYVQDPKFLLWFLRGDNYDIPKTIWRLMHHFDIKLEIFGEEL